MANVKVEGPAGCITLVAIFAAIYAFTTWVVMLLSGALGHIFEKSILFLSFPEAALVALALTVIGSFFRS